MSLIADTLLAYLPPKHKRTPSGWISFNAVCCHHNGNSADTRQRGGFIVNAGDAVSYHCFNCGFKASWQPGRLLTPKMKKFMQWLSIPDGDINKMALDALRLKEDAEGGSKVQLVPTFTPRALPLGAKSLEEWSTWIEMQGWDQADEQLIETLCYLRNIRGMDPYQYPYYWSNKVGFKNRVIVPFYNNRQIVGWTARAIKPDINPKYLSEQQPGYVFNLDRQHWDRQFVIVVEGPFDAIAVDGVALLGSEVKEGQHLLINQLRREVIVVPDRDQAGIKTVEQAIEFGWHVSMPEWPQGVKDVSDAVKILGRPAAMWLIIKHRLQTELKIRLRMKTYFNDN
jgi:hypothetical protein